MRGRSPHSLISLCVIALNILAGWSGPTGAQSKIMPAFLLRLPQDVNSETVRIDVDVRGKSHWWTRLTTQKGTFEYAVPFRYGNDGKAFEFGDAKFLKLFIFAPGYQAIEREFQSSELTAPRVFEVVLQKQKAHRCRDCWSIRNCTR